MTARSSLVWVALTMAAGGALVGSQGCSTTEGVTPTCTDLPPTFTEDAGSSSTGQGGTGDNKTAGDCYTQPGTAATLQVDDGGTAGAGGAGGAGGTAGAGGDAGASGAGGAGAAGAAGNGGSAGAAGDGGTGGT